MKKKTAQSAAVQTVRTRGIVRKKRASHPIWNEQFKRQVAEASRRFWARRGEMK